MALFLLSQSAPRPALAGGGSLSLSGAVPGSFAITLNGSNQSAVTTLSAYSASDTTNTKNGWHVTFQATQFTCTARVGQCPAGGDSLPLSSLTMPPPTVVCASGTSCNGSAAPPTVSISSNTAIDGGSAVTVASAAANKGTGTYNFTPGTIAGGNLQLSVPSYAYASTYSSTPTVSIVSGP